MKKQINETVRLQELAGLATEGNSSLDYFDEMIDKNPEPLNNLFNAVDEFVYQLARGDQELVKGRSIVTSDIQKYLQQQFKVILGNVDLIVRQMPM